MTALTVTPLQRKIDRAKRLLYTSKFCYYTHLKCLLPLSALVPIIVYTHYYYQLYYIRLEMTYLGAVSENGIAAPWARADLLCT